LKRIQPLGFLGEVTNAILDSRVDDGVCILLVRNWLVVSLEEVLVDAKVLVEELQCRFQAFY